MAEFYLFLKWLHILSAAVGFGSNVTHFFWLRAAVHDHDRTRGATLLALVKRIDDRVAVPAYISTVVCGAWMWLLSWPALTGWLLAAAVLTAIPTLLGIAYGHRFTQWAAILPALPAPAGCRHAARMLRGWAAITLAVPLILVLMVWKPDFR
jgi:uncharacterized membrane protein